MHIFYTPDIRSDFYTLSEEESKHCVKVLRLQAGDTVQLIDGKGTIYTAEIADNHPKKCSVKVLKFEEKKKRKNYTVKIAAAPTKNITRYENFLEKVTEIGVDEIYPFISRYSERKNIKVERLEKVIIAACKQSQAFFKPGFSALQKFSDLIKTDFKGEKYIAHCYASKTKKHIKELYKKGQDVLILIGPEGDFSEAEIKEARLAGFKEVSLSDSRLRTETAGIVAAEIIDFMNA